MISPPRMNATSRALSLTSASTYAWSRAMCRTTCPDERSAWRGHAGGAGEGAGSAVGAGEPSGAAAAGFLSTSRLFDLRRLVGGR